MTYAVSGVANAVDRVSWRTLLIASAAIAPCALAGPAFANPAAGAAARGDAGDVSEIVVTATRREQTLGSVAASDSVFTAAQMEALHVKTFADLVRFTPGVTYDYTTNNIAIRGIASAAGAGVTGIYIDDAPIQMRTLYFNSNNALPSVFDLARVEVLRGPQGTLFGAGSEGGTIRYITVQPSLTALSATARAELAFTQDGAPSHEVGIATGGPIVADTLGFRLSAWERRDGGWIDQADPFTSQTLRHDANATESLDLRVALTWAPTSRLRITPAISYQTRDHKFYDQYWIALSDRGAGRFISGTPDRMADRDRFYLPTLTVEYNFDSMQFTSNTTYFGRKQRVNGYSATLYDLSYFQQLIDPSQPDGPVDPAFNPCPSCRSDLFPLLTAGGVNLPGLPDFRASSTITNKQSNFTQEFRLHSSDPAARLSWLAGVFFANQKQRSSDEAVDPSLPAIAQYLFGETMDEIWGMGLGANDVEYANDTTSVDRQIAVFFDATLNLTTKLRLNAGLRYAITHFEFVNRADGPLNFGPSGGEGEQNERPVTPKVEISYQVDKHNLLYFTAAKGFRIGGANAPFPESLCQADLETLQIASVPSNYQSDSVMSYELGARDRLLGGRLTTAVSVFHAEWSDIQQSNYLPSCGFQYTANMGQAVSDGMDMEAHVRVTDAFRLNWSVNYTDARYTETTRSGPAADAPVLVAKGNSLGSPRWTLALGGQYDFTLLHNPTFVRADYAYSSGDPRAVPARDPSTASYDAFLVAQPATHFVSARAGQAINDWDFALFIDNVFDAHPQLNLNHQDQYTLLLEAATFRPRTTGVSISRRF